MGKSAALRKASEPAKRKWQTPRVRVLPIADVFEPGIGVSEAHWLAAKRLREQAAKS